MKDNISLAVEQTDKLANAVAIANHEDNNNSFHSAC